MKIGVLSDTHGRLLPSVLRFLEPVDEIWHAGDIGDLATLETLQSMKPVRAVSGNIDGNPLRSLCPEIQVFSAGELTVVMKHIGGTPSRYDRNALKVILEQRPGLFICGHSHILKVMFDRKQNLLYMNPGAAGTFGFHRSVTALRFLIDGKNMKDLEVLDLPRTQSAK